MSRSNTPVQELDEIIALELDNEEAKARGENKVAEATERKTFAPAFTAGIEAANTATASRLKQDAEATKAIEDAKAAEEARKKVEADRLATAAAQLKTVGLNAAKKPKKEYKPGCTDGCTMS